MLEYTVYANIFYEENNQTFTVKIIQFTHKLVTTALPDVAIEGFTDGGSIMLRLFQDL